MKKTKKVVYKVQCFYNPEHVFDKVYAIEEGSTETESQVEAFCPFCDNIVSIQVQGKVIPDEKLLRQFNI